jgi:hypothetical protein
MIDPLLPLLPPFPPVQKQNCGTGASSHPKPFVKLVNFVVLDLLPEEIAERAATGGAETKT